MKGLLITVIILGVLLFTGFLLRIRNSQTRTMSIQKLKDDFKKALDNDKKTK